MDKESLEIGAGVIETERDGLSALAGVLRDSETELSRAFIESVELCLALKGRLIVTGMGKSGHVARKIAATFASTGTPASFVHPAEASHGDLGMITGDDLILALSFSGETAELGDVVAHARRFRIKLIAITGNAEATLARGGDAVLILPGAAEACSAAPAPTTSTTMMMALGDALAVAVLRRKGFTESQFREFHPGGKLGATLTRVTDLMHHTDMPLRGAGDLMPEVVKTISDRGFGCAGIVDTAGALIGIITDGDLRRHISQDLGAMRARDIMTSPPHVVSRESLAGEALALFSEKKITSVFIVDREGKPIGLVHVHDCLNLGVI